MRPATIELRRARFDWSRAYIAGVLNVTPDSFSDGGLYLDPAAALAGAEAMVAAGADLIDVGGESTRPGAAVVPINVELERVIPVIERLAAAGLPAVISIDTTKAEVARAALAAGAEVVNDISGGRFDPEVPKVAAENGAVFICGHVRGRTIAEVHAGEDDPAGFDDVLAELSQQVAALPASLRGRTLVDPGLGFGKRSAQNLEISRRAGELGNALSCAVMVGPSRKRFVRQLAGGGSIDAATVGAALAAVAAGAHVIRVHDVEMLRPSLTLFEAVRGER